MWHLSGADLTLSGLGLHWVGPRARLSMERGEQRHPAAHMGSHTAPQSLVGTWWEETGIPSERGPFGTLPGSGPRKWQSWQKVQGKAQQPQDPQAPPSRVLDGSVKTKWQTLLHFCPQTL